MATKRTRRTRNRQTADFTPAELEWLTGEPQPGANRFERLMFRHLTANDTKWIDRAEAALERADWLPPARAKVLRRKIALARKPAQD